MCKSVKALFDIIPSGLDVCAQVHEPYTMARTHHAVSSAATRLHHFDKVMYPFSGLRYQESRSRDVVASRVRRGGPGPRGAILGQHSIQPGPLDMTPITYTRRRLA